MDLCGGTPGRLSGPQTYKTYGYGTRDGSFHAYADPQWRRLARFRD